MRINLRIFLSLTPHWVAVQWAELQQHHIGTGRERERERESTSCQQHQEKKKTLLDHVSERGRGEERRRRKSAWTLGGRKK